MILWKTLQINFKIRVQCIKKRFLWIRVYYTHFLLGWIMVFIRVIQHTHAPVGSFYLIFIGLKCNFVASDYHKNTFIASCIWFRLFLPLCGRSKQRNNRLFLLLRLIPPFWNLTADHLFKIAGLWPWTISTLIGWRLHTRPLFCHIWRKRVIVNDVNFIYSLQIHPYLWSCLSFVSFICLLHKLFHHVGSTGSFQEPSSEVCFFRFMCLIYGERYFLCRKFAREPLLHQFHIWSTCLLRNTINLFK